MLYKNVFSKQFVDKSKIQSFMLLTLLLTCVIYFFFLSLPLKYYKLTFSGKEERKRLQRNMRDNATLRRIYHGIKKRRI